MVVEPILALAVGGTAVLTVPLVMFARRRGRIRAWRAAVRRVGLAEVILSPGRWIAGPTLTGRSGELAVRLEDYRRGKYEVGSRILVSGLEHGAEALSLKAEGIGSRLFGTEITVGDPEFDKLIHVQGPAPLALALLDSPTRRRVRGLLHTNRVTANGRSAEMSAVLDHGVLEIDIRDHPFDPQGEQVFQALQRAIATARRLVAPADLPARLGENFRRETEAGVRLQIALTLAREFPQHQETHRVLLRARRDKSAEVRLRAAMALGEEGLETLLALADGSGIEDSCAARAVAALGDQMVAGKVKTRLERALAANSPRTAQACIESLARRGHATVEGLLVRALREGAPAVALAAIRALGRTGSVAAVAPLRVEASSLLPTAVRHAARQAIAEIQSRLTGAGPGQLALAGGDAGALSLAAGEQGGLSLLAADRPVARDPAPEQHGESAPAPRPRRAGREVEP
jgi:hypothetical protein